MRRMITPASLLERILTFALAASSLALAEGPTTNQPALPLPRTLRQEQPLAPRPPGPPAPTSPALPATEVPAESRTAPSGLLQGPAQGTSSPGGSVSTESFPPEPKKVEEGAVPREVPIGQIPLLKNPQDLLPPLAPEGSNEQDDSSALIQKDKESAPRNRPE